MPKQSYDVNENSQQKDTSFKSFICALLVFLAICLIISLLLFVVTHLGKGNSEEDNAKDQIEIFGNNKNDTGTNEKYIAITVPEKWSDIPVQTTQKLSATPSSSKEEITENDSVEVGDNDIDQLYPDKKSSGRSETTTWSTTETQNNFTMYFATEKKTQNSTPVLTENNTVQSSSTKYSVYNSTEELMGINTTISVLATSSSFSKDDYSRVSKSDETETLGPTTESPLTSFTSRLFQKTNIDDFNKTTVFKSENNTTPSSPTKYSEYNSTEGLWGINTILSVLTTKSNFSISNYSTVLNTEETESLETTTPLSQNSGKIETNKTTTSTYIQEFTTEAMEGFTLNSQEPLQTDTEKETVRFTSEEIPEKKTNKSFSIGTLEDQSDSKSTTDGITTESWSTISDRVVKIQMQNVSVHNSEEIQTVTSTEIENNSIGDSEEVLTVNSTQLESYSVYNSTEIHTVMTSTIRQGRTTEDDASLFTILKKEATSTDNGTIAIQNTSYRRTTENDYFGSSSEDSENSTAISEADFHRKPTTGQNEFTSSTFSTSRSTEPVYATSQELMNNKDVISSYTSNITDITSTEKYLYSLNKTDIMTAATASTKHSGSTVREIMLRNVLGTIKGRKLNAPIIHEEVCHSDVCNKEATRMLSLMNHLADKCENIYEYACGGQSTENKHKQYFDFDLILTYLNGLSGSSMKYLKDFKMFYASCVAHEDVFNYEERVKHVFSKTFHGQSQHAHDMSKKTTEIFAEAVLGQYMPFFDIGLDMSEESTYVLQLTLPGGSALRSSIDEWSVYSQARKYCAAKEKMKMHNSHYVNLNYMYDSFSQCVLREVKRKIIGNLQTLKLQNMSPDFILQFEKMPSPKTIREGRIYKDYNKYSIPELNEKYHTLNWTRFFEIVTGGVTNEHVIHVYHEDYFDEFFNSLSSALVRDVSHMFYANMFENTVIPKEKENREEYCMKLGHQLMPDIVTYIYRTTYPANRENDIGLVTMFKKLQLRFEESLKKSEFLDDEIRKFFIDKLRQFKHVLFSVSDITLYSRELTRKYSDLSIGLNYQENVMQNIKHYRKMLYSLVGQNVSDSDIYSYFVEVNDDKPRSFPAINTIALPAGMFRRTPVSLPRYIRLAKTGLDIARELIRGINLYFDEGRVHPKEDIADSVRDVYTNYLENVKSNLNYENNRMVGRTNVTFEIQDNFASDQLVAEIAAFRLINDTLDLSTNNIILPWISSTHSTEELFFIAASQGFCENSNLIDFMIDFFETENLPSALKIKEIMRNSPAFSKLFGCEYYDSADMDLENNLQFPYLSESMEN